MRKIVATLTRRNYQSPGHPLDEFIVEVMAIAHGYAMVRRKGCMPFIVDFTDLKDIK